MTALGIDAPAEGRAGDRGKEKRPPIIALGWASGGLLFLIIAVMSFFASLAAGGTVTLNHVFQSWSAGLTEQVTVQLVPDAAMPAAEQLERTLVILRATPGIADVRPLTRAEATRLIEPWIGSGNLPEDVALPQLVEVRIDGQAPPDFAALADRLEATVPGAGLDDHNRWKSQLAAYWGWVTLTEVLALTLIMLATIATMVFATRAVLEANRELVDLLHLMGARDGFIAGEFQRHFSWIGAAGGAAGAIAAMLALLALTLAGGSNPYFAPALEGGLWMALIVILVPGSVCALTLLTARITALAILRRTI